MKLLFKQRVFSWFDSYDIYDEAEQTVFTVKGRPSFGHCLYIYDARGNHIGTVKEELLTFTPRFAMYVGENYVGQIKKEITLFRPRYTLDCNGWQVEGDFLGWDYCVTAPHGVVMRASKELLRWSDTYVLDVVREKDVLFALMIVLAIDAVRCSAKN